MKTLPPHAQNGAARRVADTVARIWHPTHGTHDLEIPLSVVAGLSLIQPGPDEHALARTADRRRAGEVLLDMVRCQWHHAIANRPDLAAPLAPLVWPWHGDHPVSGRTWDTARDLAAAAAGAGLFDLTADTDTRRSIDVLAPVRMNLRGEQPWGRDRGAYVSAAAVAARLPGVSAFRVVRDPADATWLGLDLEPTALACAATNAITWELGPKVVLGIGGALDGEVEAAAFIQREHALQVAEQARADQRMRSGGEGDGGTEQGDGQGRQEHGDTARPGCGTFAVLGRGVGDGRCVGHGFLLRSSDDLRIAL